jgi:hypothetical protein
MLVKTEYPGLVRDTVSTAVINTNKEAFDNYKMAREEKLRVQKLAGEVSNLQQDVSEIKGLLMQLIKQG